MPLHISLITNFIRYRMIEKLDKTVWMTIPKALKEAKELGNNVSVVTVYNWVNKNLLEIKINPLNKYRLINKYQLFDLLNSYGAK